MENILGIVAEYNPFHLGHLYHITKSKELSDSSYVVAIMSGNFVQRGDTSIVDKWTKTQMALLNGVDLVIELPTLYAISSAENFAYGSMRILDSLKIVDNLSFGSEVGDIEILNSIADVIHREPPEYVSILKHELNKGVSYPTARERALLIYLNDVRRYANVLSGSNNILGIEYLKALKKINSKILPYTLQREGANYSDTVSHKGYASSTAIRKWIEKDDFSSISKVVPQNVSELLLEKIKKGNVVPNISVLEKQIIYQLRKMSLSQIADIQDVTEGLENNLQKAANSCNNLSDFIFMVKNKRITQTRIQRILLYTLLGITKTVYTTLLKPSPYIRVLGMNENGKKVLSAITDANPKLQIVTSVKSFLDTCSDKNLKSMLLLDILATNIYTLGFEYESMANLDYTQKMLVIE